jgi:hypothetical protein
MRIFMVSRSLRFQVKVDFILYLYLLLGGILRIPN